MVLTAIFSFPGSPAYDSVRSLTYHEANVFLLCYKISDPISLYNVKNKWIGEIRKHRPDAPVVLCGCQVSKLVQNMIHNTT
jgi:GTPase SAR1 family protein